MILVDTNVLLDLATDDPVHAHWSEAQLIRAVDAGERCVVNDVIYAELSVRMESLDLVESFLMLIGAEHEPIPRQALFEAGKAVLRYRSSRDSLKTGVLPDFFIGAHAKVAGYPILTRDSRRFRAYFPEVELITPGS